MSKLKENQTVLENSSVHNNGTLCHSVHLFPAAKLAQNTRIQETWIPGVRQGSVPGKGASLYIVMSSNNNWNTFYLLLSKSALLRPEARLED